MSPSTSLVSIPIIKTRIIKVIYRLGSDIKRSARWFFIGLGCGIVAVALIGYGHSHHHGYQIGGLILLIPTGLLMGYGYIGILANRLAQIVKRLTERTRHP